jgi:hypothetical protein
MTLETPLPLFIGVCETLAKAPKSQSLPCLLLQAGQSKSKTPRELTYISEIDLIISKAQHTVKIFSNVSSRNPPSRDFLSGP